jgi:hypothetical protein
MSPAKSLLRIRDQAARMRAIVKAREVQAPVPRSSWCVAAHLDHTLKVTNSTLQILLKPELPVLPKGINLIGRLVLITGWIPRGRGRSPERLRGAQVPAEELEAQLALLDELIVRVAAEPSRNASPVFRHPFFGGLTFAESLTFLTVHTDHHLKIIGAS